MFYNETALQGQLHLRCLTHNSKNRGTGFHFPNSVSLDLLTLETGSGFGVARYLDRECRFTFSGSLCAQSVPLFSLALDRPNQALAAIKELENLQAMLDEQPCAQPPIPKTTQERLQAALIAYDSAAEGMSYRDIARRIYGEKVVEGFWSDIDRVLKNRTVRAVQRGRRLVEEDYRKLLS